MYSILSTSYLYTPTSFPILRRLCDSQSIVSRYACKRNVGQHILKYVMPAVEAATRKLMGACQFQYILPLLFVNIQPFLLTRTYGQQHSNF